MRPLFPYLRYAIAPFPVPLSLGILGQLDLAQINFSLCTKCDFPVVSFGLRLDYVG